jgi:hypothetical protein
VVSSYSVDDILISRVCSLHEEARQLFSTALESHALDVVRIAGITLALTVVWLGERGIDT